jgi:hypothetical protein
MFLSTWKTHGKDLTDEEIKKKLKQVILIPETYLQFCNQLKIFIDTIKILSGDESKATYILEDFQELVIAERDKLESLFESNKEVAPFILYQVGMKINNFIEQSGRAKSPADVSRRFLDLSYIKDRIENNDISPNLPKTFKSMGGKSKRPFEDDPSDTEEETPRRTKPGRVRNSKPVDGWILKDGEDWAKFSGENCKDRLKWDDSCRFCHKFHIKGVCYSDCKDAASHVPDSEINGSKKREFTNWRASKLT